jgi:IS4 transposase
VLSLPCKTAVDVMACWEVQKDFAIRIHVSFKELKLSLKNVARKAITAALNSCWNKI